jgi:hypothetical protein
MIADAWGNGFVAGIGTSVVAFTICYVCYVYGRWNDR